MVHGILKLLQGIGDGIAVICLDQSHKGVGIFFKQFAAIVAFRSSGIFRQSITISHNVLAFRAVETVSDQVAGIRIGGMQTGQIGDASSACQEDTV